MISIKHLRIVLILSAILLLSIIQPTIIFVDADSLEESFKVTPLPFWDIETENATVQFKDNSISFASDSISYDWLTGWNYRKSHNLLGASGAGTDYQIKLSVHYGNPTFENRTDTLAIDGRGEPTFGVINYPCNAYFNGVTYVTWGGTNPIAKYYIKAYNHTSDTWSSTVNFADSSFSGGISKGSPAIVINSTGHIIVAYDLHEEINVRVSTNPEDITTWESEQAPFGYGTYPKLEIDADDNIYFFVMHGTIHAPHKQSYVKSVDGGATWGSVNTIINQGSGFYAYTGNIEFDNDKGIHISWVTFNETRGGGRINVTHAYFNVTDSNMYNMSGSNLGAYVDLTEAQNSCMVRDTLGSNANHPAIHFDENNDLHIIYPISNGTETGIDGTAYRYEYVYWSGSAWTSPVNITTTDNFFNGQDMKVKSSSDIDAYLTTEGLAGRDGDIEKWHYDGIDWTHNVTIMTESESGESLGDIAISWRSPDNSTFEISFCQTTPDEFVTDLEVYAYLMVQSGEKDETYLNGKCQTDFGDIQFTDNDKTTKLDFWQESYIESISSVFWVEVRDSLSNNQIIYLYYGTDGTSLTASNGTDTFLFFDDFASGSLDTSSLWDIQSANGGISFSTNDATHGYVAQIYANADTNSYSITSQDAFHYYAPFTLRMRIKLEDTLAVSQRVQAGFATYGGTQLGYFRGDSALSPQIRTYSDAGEESDIKDISESYFGAYHTFEIFRNGTDYEFYNDTSLIDTGQSSPDILNTAEAFFYVRDEEKDVWLDWVFLAKRNVTAPQSFFWGIEEFDEKQTSMKGSFSVNIPIKQFRNQKLEFMIDTVNLSDTTKLEFGIYCGNEQMNYDFSLENKTFTQQDFVFNYFEYNHLRFKLDLKYSTNLLTLKCSNENNSKLFSNIIFEGVRKTGNVFRIFSTNFNGTFSLYYFTGDVDYSSIWKQTIINKDPDTDNYMLSASSLEDDILVEHEITYDRYISNFQFLRTNIYLYTDFSISGDWSVRNRITIQIFYPNGTELYRIVGEFYRYSNNVVFSITVYEDDVNIYYTSGTDYSVGTEKDASVQFAIWRTQDNKLGTFFNDIGGDFTDNIYGTTKFLGDRQIENFQTNITITYVNTPATAGYQNYIFEMTGFELGYGSIHGVAEPHFSTTWWHTIPVIGAIIYWFIVVGHAIVSGLETIFVPMLDTIIASFGPLGGIIWASFESALDSMDISLNALANDIFGFFDNILSDISGFADSINIFVDDIASNVQLWVETAMSDILPDLFVNVFLPMFEELILVFVDIIETSIDSLGAVFGVIGLGATVFSLGASFANGATAIISIFGQIISIGVDILAFVATLLTNYGVPMMYLLGLFAMLDITSALATGDSDNIGEALAKYAKIVEFILNIVWSITNAVIQFIGGIIP